MKHIRHNTSRNIVTVGSGDPGGKRVIPVVHPYRVDLERNPIAEIIYWDVLYPAIEARDRRIGRKGVSYSLVHPDPWLVALGMVMWEGILQGATWDTIKYSVQKALGVMQAEKVAPRSTRVKSGSKRTEIGFCWTDYIDGKKQYHMFIGLRRAHRYMIKHKNK